MKNMIIATLLILTSTAAFAETEFGLQCLQNKSIVHHSDIGPIALTAGGGLAKKGDLNGFKGQKISVTSATALKAHKNIPSLETTVTIKDIVSLGSDQASIKVDVLSYKNVWFICDIVARTGEL